jgi:hypothetical protein
VVNIRTTRFNIQKFYFLNMQCFYAFFYWSENKQLWFPYAALTFWFLAASR